MQPPIFLSEQRMQGIWNRLGINQFQLMTDQVEFQSTASNTWQTAWTITGVGMLQLLALSWVEGGTGGQTGVRLLIDGNVVISETSVYNNDTDGGVIVVGYTAWGGFSSNEDPTIYLPENIAYNQSVQVQVRSNDIGPSLINSVNFRYQQFS